ncbi:MAG TPA: serine hydrolase, partial [Thermoanaerobaculia bacterium]|nr:serine hydrolase [Thermoanaerobaculia bacterium]
ALILAGGGVNAPEIVQRFIDVAGGPNAPIVVIPTAADQGRLAVTPERVAMLRARFGEIFKTNDVAVLHTRDRTVADSEEFVKPLQRARGVWMLGGETSWLLDAYRGTRTERELKAVVARGGVVGGTSAGAIAQTSTLLSEDGKRRIDGFGLISGVFVWPHWTERNARDALVKYTAQIGDVVGIGIDEATAIVVQGSAFEVVGEGNVGVTRGKGLTLLKRGDRFDLAKKTALGFRGSYLVARGGEVMLRHAGTTSMCIGSLTKQFTAAAVLLLEERGKLRTDDPIGRYLDVPAEWSDITIYHLLTHTSGIPSEGTRLNFEPGTEWMYSNEGYVLLGKLIERVTGRSYAAFIAEVIFAPLGMRDSAADPQLADLGGAGALRSTADDLGTWERALFGGKLLSPASLVKMTTPFRNGYGCALHLVVSPTRGRVFANDGRVPGACTSALRYYADERLVVAVLSDFDNDVVTDLARNLAVLALPS